MYKLLLTFRYLRRKLIPLFALAAVTLCTWVLIVVLSIMGGFHNLLLNSGTKLIGDVQLYAGVQGISDYDKILAEIRELPQTESAAATIQTIGLLQIPNGPTLMVEIIGADPDELTHVIHYKDTLYWSAERLEKQNLAAQYGPHDPVEAAMKLATPWPRLAEYPAMVMGIEVNPYNTRLKDGSYDFPYPLLARPLSLTLVPVSSRGGILEPATQQFIPVNEFHSGLYDADSKRIFIPFTVAQKMLMMDQATRVNPADPTKILGTVPARCTTIVVRAKAGYTADQLCAAINTRYAELVKANPDLPDYMQIRTWQELLRKLLDTVQNEKNLMMSLFGGFSVLAVILVLVIFYMIVLEKTRDIGILRALGASRAGIASIFLTYAAVIGVIGSVLGTTLAVLTVHYINEIHAWLGDGLGTYAFYAGIPLGAMLLVTLLLIMQHVLRLVFEVSRWAMIWIMPALGASLGTLAVLVYVLFVLFDRLSAPAFGWIGTSLVAVIAPTALLVLLSPLFAWSDTSDKPLPRKPIVGTLCVAGSLAMIFVFIAAGTTHLADWCSQNISVQIWDRRVYFFDRIPNRIDPFEVSVIVAVSILACVIGALIPVVKAALVDPIESLRYE